MAEGRAHRQYASRSATRSHTGPEGDGAAIQKGQAGSNMSDLGTYAEGFNAFRRMMAAVPETSRLEIFQNAANEAARYVQGASRGCRQRSVVPSARARVRNLTGRCRAVIRLSRDPTRRRWRRGDGRHDSDGGRVSAPVIRLSMPLPDLMRGCRQWRKSPRTSLGLYS